LGGVIIIVFADKKALLFLGVILAILTVAYFLSVHVKKRRRVLAALEQQEGGGRILIGSKRDGAPESLVKLTAQLIGEQMDTGVCLFRVVKTPLTLPVVEIEKQIAKEKEEQLKTMAQVGALALEKNFPIYTKLVPATRVEEGFMRELQTHHDVKLLLLGFPRDPEKARLPHNVLKEILLTAQRDVAIVRDKGLPPRVKRVLVALGTGPNAVLGLQLARDMLDHEDEEIVAMRVVRDTLDEEHHEDEIAKLHLVVDEVMGESPALVDIKLVESDHAVDAFLDELAHGSYDLFVLGAGGGLYKSDELFGSFTDTLMEESPVSVMVVRRYQREGAYWLGQQLKKIEE
jgi:nucleotide-binding universal stress UspA family protein